MPMVRTVQCNICGKQEAEEYHGKGWDDWLWIQGAVLDGESSIWLCPDHRNRVMDFIDEMKNGKLEVIE